MQEIVDIVQGIATLADQQTDLKFPQWRQRLVILMDKQVAHIKETKRAEFFFVGPQGGSIWFVDQFKKRSPRAPLTEAYARWVNKQILVLYLCIMSISLDFFWIRDCWI